MIPVTHYAINALSLKQESLRLINCLSEKNLPKIRRVKYILVFFIIAPIGVFSLSVSGLNFFYCLISFGLFYDPLLILSAGF